MGSMEGVIISIMSAESQLIALGITLPPAPPKGGIYKPVVIVGNVAYVSGH